MTSRFLVSAVVFAAFAAVGASPTFALSTKECSVKYQAAKSAGTLNGETWNEFRKKECAGADTAAPAPAEEKPAAKTETTAPSSGSGAAVFPKAIDAKYSKESAGKARMHTCLDQYRANKANNGNGGLKWIQKLSLIHI